MKVFLSYSATDAELASEVARQLESAGLSVWRPTDIPPGEDPYKRMSAELESADAMVVILTPQSAESNWVRRELEYALSSARLNRRVFPILSGWKEDEQPKNIPWILNHLKPFDVSTSSREKVLRDLTAVLKHAY
jgi:hypothetical protein